MKLKRSLAKPLVSCLIQRVPEIRTTVEDTPNGKIEFHTGDKVRISMDASLKGTKEKVAVTYPGLYDDTHVGGYVLFDDGLIDMKITEKDEKNRELVTVVFKMTVFLVARKGSTHLVLRSTCQVSQRRIPTIFVLVWTMALTFIAASFVRKSQDVLDIRELLEEKNAT